MLKCFVEDGMKPSIYVRFMKKSIEEVQRQLFKFTTSININYVHQILYNILIIIVIE